MEWRDRGVVLGTRAYGETSVILELLTAAHGRHLGVVRGGRSRRLRPVLQPGNSVSAVWRARLDDQLGAFSVEGEAMRAARTFEHARSLHALNHLTGLARLLPERDPHDVLYAMLDAMIEGLDAAALPLQIIQFELELLSGLGFGLDLAKCAATGSVADLRYVSPKSGRAVSGGAGAAYADRLLALPQFLRPGSGSARVTEHDLAAAFHLTEHFLRRDVFAPRKLPTPDARRAYLAALCGSPPLHIGRSALLDQP